MKTYVEVITPETAKEHWGQIFPPLEKLVLAENDNEADFKEKVCTGIIDLWMVHGKGKGFIATQINGDEKTTFQILYAVGKWDGKQNTRAIIQQFGKLAKANNCHSLKITGRKGWKKIFPEFDAQIDSNGKCTLRKAL